MSSNPPVTETERMEAMKFFGISDEEVLKAVFSCSLKQGVSAHSGRLFISGQHIMFYGKKGPFSLGEDKRIWDFDSILEVEKIEQKNIRIILTSERKYVFGSFGDTLDRCFNTLQRTIFGILGNSALHQAVEEKDMIRIKQILDMDVTKLNMFNKSQQAPLHIAFMKNDPELVRMLLEYYRVAGGKVDINMVADKTRNTFLHVACSIPAIEDEILTMLLDIPTINVEVLNADNNTPLHYFCEHNHSLNCKKLGAVLIAKAKNPKEYLVQGNLNKETPMHKAVFNKKLRLFMVDMLVKHHATVDCKNEKEETPLIYAVRLGREDLIEALLRAGSDPSIATLNGQTARQIADQTLAEAKSDAARIIADLLQQVDNLRAKLVRCDLLEQFTKFISAGFYEPDQFALLDEATLGERGIEVKMGPMIKLNKEVEATRAELATIAEAEAAKNEAERKRRAMLPPDEDPDEKLDASQTDVTKVRSELGLTEGTWEIDGSDLEYTKKLGSGTSGKVYKGLLKGKEVAIKVLIAVDAADQMEEFKKEFFILTTVRSPYMVTFFGASVTPKLTMVMEYCSRGSLYHVLNNKQMDVNWEQALAFCSDMACGMEVLHNFKPDPIVHRDLKSLNLLVTNDWRVKVCDFGLSRMTGGNNLETFKKLCGTFAYCAPEIFSGGTFTDRSDVYSMGIVLWEVVYRAIRGGYQQPFSEFPNLHHDFQIMLQAASGVRPTIPPETPQVMRTLIEDCVAAEVAKRPTAGQVAERLAKIKKDYRTSTEEWDKALFIHHQKK
jgi:ankyrin repeat protein